MDRSRKIRLVLKKRFWKQLPDEEIMAFWKKVVEVADEVRECAEMKNLPSQKGDLDPRPLLS